MKVQISFYDEKISIILPSEYNNFKKLVGQSYALEPSDVDELQIFFFAENKTKCQITNNQEFQNAIFFFNKCLKKDKNSVLQIFLEVSEQSKLFQSAFKNPLANEEETERLKKEKLHKEIMEKEKILKELLQRESL